MNFLIINILESFLGDCKQHSEDSGQCKFDCIACSEEKGLLDGDGKGNLEINYKKGVYKCWACHDHNDMYGPIIKLLYKYANKAIINQYKLIYHDLLDPDYKKEHKSVFLKLPDGFKFFTKSTPKDYKYNQAIDYLKNRGITDSIIEKYNIGYTPIGDYANRIIFPSYDSYGKLNYFVGRWFLKQKNKLKYMNPDVEKQNIVFNEMLINWDADIYLVEGVTDHVVIPNSIPLLGKHISDYLLKLLYEKANCKIIIVLDGDAYKDTIELYKKLNIGNLYGRIRVCIPKENLDPSKIYEKYGPKGIYTLLKTAKKPNYLEL